MASGASQDELDIFSAVAPSLVSLPLVFSQSLWPSLLLSAHFPPRHKSVSSACLQTSQPPAVAHTSNSKFLCQAYQNIYNLVSALFTPFLPGHYYSMPLHFSFSSFLSISWNSNGLHSAFIQIVPSAWKSSLPLLSYKCSCFSNPLKGCGAFWYPSQMLTMLV